MKKTFPDEIIRFLEKEGVETLKNFVNGSHCIGVHGCERVWGKLRRRNNEWSEWFDMKMLKMLIEEQYKYYKLAMEHKNSL